MTVKVSKPAINVREELADLRKPTGLAGEAMLRAETPQEQFQLINAGRKNLFYNGAMQIAQRSTSAVTVSDNSNEGYSTVDRWKIDFGSGMGGVLAAERVGSPAGHGPFSESLKLSCTTVNGGAMTSGSTRFLSVAQYLEGNDLQQLCYGEPDAKDTTYSFWVYTNKTGRYGFSAISRDSGDSYDVWGSYFDVPTANVWQKVVFTVEGNTAADIKRTNSYGLLVDIYLAVAADRAGISDSQWQGYSSARVPGTYTDYVDFLDNTSNVFYITGLQLETGKVATPFEHRSYGEELALCQRYYERLVQGGDGYNAICVSVGLGSQYAYGVLDFKTTKRAAPTMSYDGDFRLLGAPNVTGITTLGEFYNPQINKVRMRSDTGGTNLTNSNAYVLEFSGANSISGGFIAADAEL
jgi:hypothetical protein